MNKPYELLEHTADIRIRVKAKSLSDLFRRSALAMFDIIADGPAKDKQLKAHTLFVRQAANNAEELFINWLNELLSLSQAKGLIFNEFIIEKMDEKYIEARVSGFGMSAYWVNVEIKAATYHQLSVKKVAQGWQAEVIFDV